MKSIKNLLLLRAAGVLLAMVLFAFTVQTAFAQALTISSDADWVTFANNVNNGMSYSGQTVKLAADINVTTVVGTDSTKFKGTFDGAGHTINLALTASEDRCAPFRYVDGATISLLTVTGTVSTGTNKYGAGLIAESKGSVTVKNCRSSVTVSGDRSSLDDKVGTHGGFVSLEESGSLTFINCLFDGSISDQSATNCGGFVGWRSNGSLTFNNCLMAGTLNIDVDNNSATFNRNGSSTLNNSYYITSYGTAQGISASGMSNDSLLSKLGSGWEIINNKVVPIVNTKNLYFANITGLKKSYVYTGSAISLAYVVKDFDGNTLVSGTHYDVSLTKGGTSVSEVNDKGTYTLTITARDGSGYIGSQSVTFEVGDYVEIGDPGSSASSYQLPVNMYYNSTLAQQIFTAEEIGAAGVINSLSFEYLHTSSFSLDGIQVYMKTVGDKATFNSNTDMLSVSASDKVWEGTFSATGAGWVTINLDIPFRYDCKENLLVCFYDPVADSYLGNSYKFRTTNTTGNTSISYYHDSKVPDLNNLSDYSGNKTTYSCRNNIRLGIVTGDFVAWPSSLEATEIKARETTLAWSGGTGIYNVEYKKAADSDWISVLTNTTETSFNLTSLTPDTKYQVRVQSVDGEEVSVWKKIDFTTLISCHAPTNLAATLTTGNATEATLSWTENGSATSWEICLNNDETSLITATDNSYTLTGLTPETVYTAKVRAVNSDSDKSRWSDAVTFEPTDKQVIGSGTGSYSYLPLYNYYKQSLTQQIYTAEELGTAGLIESIDFKNVGSNDCSRNIDIYMVSTDKTTFRDSVDWISATAADLVFSGEVTFAAGSWTGIELDNPFDYDGQSNVAIIVDDNTGSYTSSINFLAQVTGDYSSLYIYDDNTNYNPASPGSYNGKITNYKNIIRILKTATNFRPTNLVASEVGSVSVKLSWTDNCTPTAQKWEVAYKTTNDDDFSEVTTTKNPFLLTGLTPETEYTVKVRPVVDDETIIKWSRAITFTTIESLSAPTDIAFDNVKDNSATVSWIGNNEVTSYKLRYKKVQISPMAVITLKADDVWNDGTGYQMLIDADSTAYGTIIPAESGLTSSDDASDETYAEFEYKIPEDADGSLYTTHMLRDSTSTTEIPAGTYDWCITNPTPGDRIWIASGNGTVGGRADNYVFEAGKKYEFHVYMSATGEAVDVTVTDAIDEENSTEEWTVVNGVTSPYTIEGLDAKSYYMVEVQAVYADGESQWSSTNFKTLGLDAAPFNLQATDVTANTATLDWDGVQDSYNVRYRKNPVIYSTLFNSSEDREGWNYNTSIYGVEDTVNNISGDGNYFLEMGWNSTDEQFIISPKLPAYPSGSILEFYHFYYDDENTFQVGYSTTTNETEAFTWSEPIETVSYYDAYSVKFSEVLPDGVKYIAFKATAEDKYHCIFIDNLKIYKGGVSDDEWNEVNANTNTLAITELAPNTNYEWQVQGIYNGEPTEWSEVATFTTDVLEIQLANNSTDNSTLVDTYNGNEADVTLTGRTLYKDGKWNTICLPFDVDLTDENSPLYGADARELNSANITGDEASGHTLHLSFSDAVTDSLKAGVPYIIKWTEGDNITDPVFPNVTISNTYEGFDNGVAGDYRVRFLGIYNSTTLDAYDKSCLYFGANNKLMWPDQNVTLGSCRAYFKIGENNAVNAKGITGFVIDFGDNEEATGVNEAAADSSLFTPHSSLSEWHTVDGIRLNGKPSKKGMYIHNGKTVVIE